MHFKRFNYLTQGDGKHADYGYFQHKQSVLIGINCWSKQKEQRNAQMRLRLPLVLNKLPKMYRNLKEKTKTAPVENMQW